jgi:hypothetical protein
MSIFDGVIGNAKVNSASSNGGTPAPAVPGSGTPNAIQTINNFQVDYTPPGASVPGLYQASGQVPAGFLPTVTSAWTQLVSATPGAIPVYSSTTTYPLGQFVQYTPSGAQLPGLYQVILANAPAGTLPTNATYFVQVVSPGPQVLFDADITNPSLAAVSAPGAGIPSIQKTNGTALAALTVPPGRGYKLIIQDPRPATRGTSLATDHMLRLLGAISEAQAADGVSWNVTITPYWFQEAFANNSAIAAVSTGTVAVRLRVELI